MVFISPDDVADEYLTHLKLLKPEVNKDQTDSDWWIRSRVVGGTVSGVYQDQNNISNDAFPQSARHEALDRHLFMYFNGTFNPATSSIGPVKVTGINGSPIPAGTQFLYVPNGNIYQSLTTSVLSGPSGVIEVQSVSTGQSQNLLEGAELTLSSPPPGLDSTAVVFGDDLKDARDPETDQQASDRVLTRLRTPLGDGKVSDYELFALAADPSVVTATVVRYPTGFGSVLVVITAGTTDIDFALDNGQAIVRTPSAPLIETVQEYIEAHNVLTDCALVTGPDEVIVDVNVNVTYVSGNNSTIPANQIPGQTLTQQQLVIREVQRAIYKNPPGGRRLGASGFLIASDIEEVLDNGLSAEPYNTGRFPILNDRQVLNLNGSNQNYLLTSNQIAVPGVITITEV